MYIMDTITDFMPLTVAQLFMLRRAGLQLNIT